ncbi:hypothetical protein [Tateyamaria sp. ANG-S1]|uniref:hypothetical protein n=1 Tax=Tateyamaria sp. ANG-S1 TaxID=1577905 RepID=UPI00126A7312|nr:hypothetical protein [Tateyamaria sp. ANG-S1]
MEAILHIGTEKTGTTSFQRYCYNNQAELMEQGIFYPAGLGGENHRFISMYGLEAENADEAMRAMNIQTASDQEKFRAKVEKTLDNQISGISSGSVALFSSEHLHSRLKDVASIGRVKSLLDQFFEKVTVVVHLRPQIDVAISLASTQARVGGSVRESFFNQMKVDNPYYNYNMLVGMWEEVFGASNIRCISFNSSPDFLSWFTKSFDLRLPKVSTDYRINEALDVQTIAMINALVDSGTGQNIDFRVLDRLPVKEKLTLSQASARRLQNAFVISNRALIDRRDDMKVGDLQPAWHKFPEKGNLEKLSERVFFAEGFAALVGYYNDIIGEEKSKS